MRLRFIVCSVLILFISLPVRAQVDAHFSTARFYVPGASPYVEAFLHVNPLTISYKENDEGLYQAELNVTYAFIDENDEVASYEKFQVLSPPVANPDSNRESFMDRKIISVPNGNYDLEIELTDANGSDTKVTGTQKIQFSFSDDTASISDVELIAQKSKKFKPGSMWERNGLELIPYIYDFYPDHLKRLSFYTEFYNTNQVVGDAAFVAKYGIADEDGKYLPEYIRYKRYSGDETHALLSGFDITDLPSGNFYVNVELLDSNQQTFAYRSINFLQINRSVAPAEASSDNFKRFTNYVEQMGEDTLSEYIKALSPIAEHSDQSFINANHDLIKTDELRNFFVDFWLKEQPEDPAEAWFAYKKKVDEVSNTFGTRQVPGYETDRGYLYLRYGEPNTIVRRENEPSNYPYQIWHYYDHPKRSDARYIFYNPQMSTNEYRLLHSNVIGEINNTKWRQMLSRRNTPFGSVDDNERSSEFGSWSDEFFDQPR